MVQAPERVQLSGPTLVRLLARITDLDVSASSQALSERLSLWLGWTDAITLAAVLNEAPPTLTANGSVTDHPPEQAYQHLRTTLTQAIIRDTTRPGVQTRGRTSNLPPVAARSPETDTDYASFRQRYLSLQNAMETGISTLRSRLRGRLTTGSPNMTRLAMMDAVMERALSAYERPLLARIPTLLAAHFERLCNAEIAALERAETPDQAAHVLSGTWLSTFRQDMRNVLMAELEIRLQPLQGLLAALPTR